MFNLQALIGVSYSIGFLIGPMIGAFFSTFASRDDGFSSAPAIFCILLTIIELAAILLLLPETLDFENQKVVANLHNFAKVSTM